MNDTTFHMMSGSDEIHSGHLRDCDRCVERTAQIVLAAEFVKLFTMHDWIWNERRQEIANLLGLTNHWQSHAAYLEARKIAGLDR